MPLALGEEEGIAARSSPSSSTIVMVMRQHAGRGCGACASTSAGAMGAFGARLGTPRLPSRCVGSPARRDAGRVLRAIDPNLEQMVPRDQRPVNELTALRDGPLSGWAALETPKFVQNLGGLWVAAFALCAPISAASFSPQDDALGFFLGAGLGASLIQMVAVLRILTSWSYVSKRLLSAAIEYEETGWYDGQTWMKPPEVLARDRLLGLYEAQPIVSRLKLVAYGTAGGLMACVLSLYLLDATRPELYKQSQRPAPARTANGILYNKGLGDTTILKQSDAAAALEAAAQRGRPGYCGDDYYRALAGGSAAACDKLTYAPSAKTAAP